MQAHTPETMKVRLRSHSLTNDEGCWLWRGSKGASGYGQVSFQGKLWRTHRLAYTLFNGAIPEGLFVCHTCDTPACCNPSHLFVGTAADNCADMMRKGRNFKGYIPDEVRDRRRVNIRLSVKGHNVLQALAIKWRIPRDQAIKRLMEMPIIKETVDAIEAAE